MINVFEFVLLILIIVFVYRGVEAYLKSRSAQANNDSNQDMEDQLKALEERIRVLERIVTDERFDLKREFRNLED